MRGRGHLQKLMQLTPEQKEIIDSTGDLKINAVAGSGKTTTLIEYARARSPEKSILYIAFNRSVRLEAQRKFAEAGLPRVDVQTAHSLAYRHIIPRYRWKVTTGYRSHELVKILKIRGVRGEPHSALLIATHIAKLATLFCNNTTEKVSQLDYLGTVGDSDAAQFAEEHLENIFYGTRLFLGKMNKGEIACTHEFYLKKFQLSHPNLPHDIILFDEGQDASPVMLDIFLRQKACRIIVGDVHQQIYGWRHAVNALHNVEFQEKSLTTSFRFDQSIANVAMKVLTWKRLLGLEVPEISIKGVGKKGPVRTRAALARTNLSLLREAVEQVEIEPHSRIYFEGNLSSYAYAADGASLYDVLNLHLDNRDSIRDPVVKSMRSIDDLAEYASKSSDYELQMIIELVLEFKGRLPRLLKRIRTCHVEDEDRRTANRIFSTVHRCKGLEYDSVHLTDDFITEEKIVSILSEKKSKSPPPINELNEEVNILYVALTRARSNVEFPASLHSLENVIKPKRRKKKTPQLQKRAEPKAAKGRKPKRPNSGKPWSGDEDERLESLFCHQTDIIDIAEELGRSPAAVRHRIEKLDLEGLYDIFYF